MTEMLGLARCDFEVNFVDGAVMMELENCYCEIIKCNGDLLCLLRF